MAQDYCYRIDDGDYVLYDADEAIAPGLPEVAIGYVHDETGPSVMKHGDPARVDAWAEVTRATLKTVAGLGERMASEIHVTKGKFDLENLNLAIAGAHGGLRRILAAQNTIDVEASPVSENAFTKDLAFTEITPITKISSQRRAP